MFLFGDWKLVARPFMILIKWQYNKIYQSLSIYHF